MSDISPDSFLGVGLYSIPEAERVLSQFIGERLRKERLHRWAFGYRYSYAAQLRDSAPLLEEAGLKLYGLDLFTFAQLVELLVIGAFRREGVSLPVIRAVHRRARIEYVTQHPFVLQRFDTDGKTIFGRLTREEVGNVINEDQLTLELQRGQIAMDVVLRPSFRNIDYVNEIASRLWPLGHDRTVVLDPERTFGKPINEATGVPTSIIYAMHRGGSPEVVISDWYEVTIDGVNDAIEYESSFRSSG